MRAVISHFIFALVVLVAFALICPSVAPHDPSRLSLTDRFKPPCWEYPLGTDALGRCHLSRSLVAAQTTVIGGLLSSICSLFFGILVCCFSLIGGKWVRIITLTVSDALLSIPSIFIVLSLISVKGASMATAVLGISLSGAPWWIRFLSHIIPSAYEKDFVVATYVAGVRGLRLLFHCVLPCIGAPVMTAFLVRTVRFMLLFGSLGFIGFGGFTSIPEWGGMLKEGIQYLHRAPWLIFGPFAGFSMCGGMLIFCAARISRLFPGGS